MTKYNAVPSNMAPQFLRDMFKEWQYNECDPWFDCLDEEFGENHLYQGELLTRWRGMSSRERGLWLIGRLWNDSKRPSNTPVSGIVFVMNSGHECGRWSVGWSS
jgi:hypothetical protein